jgi:L-amino acid N-acyltransferase YncA/ubiquinone/menaquinone biosynthesis C-methylase UbiE
MTDTTRDDIDQQHAKVIDRYSSLAREAIAGRTPTDACGNEQGDCFGAAPYGADELVPQSAARASLGCGNPLAVADITAGETVLDLGSGGGLDVILSARRTGPTGTVYGLDASPDMLALARTNATQAGITNADFLAGHIEDIPLPDGSVDVVISNCVINLSADKPRVLAEAFRVLKPGGRLGVTDITSNGELNDAERQAAGCLPGTVTSEQYRDQLLAAGFTTATVTPTHQVTSGLTSVIVQAAKPAAPAGVIIRPMRADDADQVLAIYQAGLDTGNASFETTAPTWDAFTAAKLPFHRHVAVEIATGRLLGWVAATAVSSRRVYAGVVEHSIYVHPDTRGRGIAAALLEALIGSAETAGIWTIQSGIFPENTASLHLHAKAGFRTIGTRHHIGQHHGQWRDVVFIERRSSTVGARPQ